MRAETLTSLTDQHLPETTLAHCHTTHPAPPALNTPNQDLLKHDLDWELQKRIQFVLSSEHLGRSTNHDVIELELSNVLLKRFYVSLSPC